MLPKCLLSYLLLQGLHIVPSMSKDNDPMPVAYPREMKLPALLLLLGPFFLSFSGDSFEAPYHCISQDELSAVGAYPIGKDNPTQLLSSKPEARRPKPPPGE